MISYWTAWMKKYYPLEYMTALLRNEEDKDKRTTYLIEAKRLGIKVLLPNVNKSGANFEIEGDAIRFGLGNIKYISDATARPIMEHRPYINFAALVAAQEIKGSGFNSRQVTALRLVGAATFSDNPRTGKESDYYYEYLGVPKFASQPLPHRVTDLVRPLDEYDETETFVIRAMVKKIKQGVGWSRVEVVDEYGSAGIFHNEGTQIETGQLYFMLVSNNRIARYVTADEVFEGNEKGTQDAFIRYLLGTQEIDYLTPGFYYVVDFSPRKTKAGKMMGTLVLLNHEGEMRSILVFPQTFAKAYGKARNGSVVAATFNKLKDGGVCLNDVE
jgi:DNA polymerase-3 subunit alpha